MESELLYTIARRVVDLEKEIAMIKRRDELPKDKSTYFAGE
jgi:hypothetical protein